MASRPNISIVLSVAALAGAGILAGCGAASQSAKAPAVPIPAGTATLSASPTSLNFVNVIGTVGSQVVTIINTGNANATISGVSASGAGFSIEGVSSGVVLEPDQSAALSVSFSPTASGIATGTATITSDATNSPTSVSLSGTATPPTSPDLTPPICGLTNDTTNHVPAATPWTNFTAPGLGSTYTDSVYGCPVKRLTNSIAFGQAQHHYYATTEPMSMGDTKILVYDESGSYHMIDLDGNVIVTEANMPPSNDGLPLWDRSSDNVFWEALKNTLQKCTVSGGATTCEANHVFTEYSGYIVQFMDSTDMTPDGWLPMVGQNTQGGQIDIFLWNPTTLTKSPVYTTSCTADVSTKNSACLHKLISTPNDGIIVGFATDGDGAEQGNRLWESPWTKPLPYVQNLTGHLDSGRDLSGNEVYATEDPLDNPGPFGTCVNGFRPTLLIVGATTPDGPSCMFDASLNPGWHVSYRDWPLSAWIVFSAQGDNTAERFNNDPSYAAPSAINWSTYDNEVVLVRVDVNNNPTYIYRLTLAHTRNVNSNSYWSDPHAVLSFDGKYVVFDSNAAWGATGCGSFTDCADLYLIQIH
jgi:hypothetical protein